MPEFGTLARTPLSQLAAAYGLHPRTAYDVFTSLRKKDVKARGKCDWWLQYGTGRGAIVYINVSRLKRAHAEFFEDKVPTREEFEELRDRLEEVEERLAALQKKQRLAEARGGELQLIRGR